jgi:hypothetical protein
LQAVLRSHEGTLIYKRECTVEGHKGLEFEVKIKKPREGYAVDRMFLANNRLYQLIVIGANYRADSKEVKEFWDSFKLTK